jgi:hypothetical protein
VLLALWVTGMEIGLARLGFKPTLADSYALWQDQRDRVDALGSRALILVGNSRMQNDVDLPTLRHDTGFAPVQLGLSGSSFLPVLRDLATDPDVKGTIVVNFEADALALPPHDDLAANYERTYESRSHGTALDFAHVEDRLSGELHFRLRSYADGTRPLTALLDRIIPWEKAKPYYVSLQPDRQVKLDFSLLNIHRYALLRAEHEISESFQYSAHADETGLRADIENAITTMKPVDDHRFQDNLRSVDDMASAIEARGGRLIFVIFPRDGLIRRIQDARYPRDRFWAPFSQAVKAEMVSYQDVPALQDFSCPDGSHLDERDQARFTAALVDTLHLNKPMTPQSEVTP